MTGSRDPRRAVPLLARSGPFSGKRWSHAREHAWQWTRAAAVEGAAPDADGRGNLGDGVPGRACRCRSAVFSGELAANRLMKSGATSAVTPVGAPLPPDRDGQLQAPAKPGGLWVDPVPTELRDVVACRVMLEENRPASSSLGHAH